MIVEPSVELLAHTVINDDVVAELMDIQPQSTDAETLVTFAGRSCYESWHRPRPETYHDKDYIDRTIFEQQHGSILEHATATLYFTGVSRAFLTELTRHRHLSFSVRSQRFVDEAGANIVMPPAIRDMGENPAKGTSVFDLVTGKEIAHGIVKDTYEMAEEFYGSLAEILIDEGATRKQAREAARAVLPSMTETKMVVTANLRGWLEVINRRTAPDADAELQEVMGMARDVLQPLAPSIFGRDSN